MSKGAYQHVRSFESKAQGLLLEEVVDAVLRDVFQGRRQSLRVHMLNVAAKVSRKHPWPFFNEVVEAEVQRRLSGQAPRDYYEAAMTYPPSAQDVAQETRTDGLEREQGAGGDECRCGHGRAYHDPGVPGCVECRCGKYAQTQVADD